MVYVNGPQGISQPYQYILYHNKRLGPCITTYTNLYHILLIPKQAHRPRILDNIFSVSAKVSIGHGICDTVCKVSAHYFNIYCTIISEWAYVYYSSQAMHWPYVYYISYSLKQARWPRILDNIYSISAKIYYIV